MSDEINSLLPDNASAHEQAFARAIARLSAVPIPIRAIWDVDACPVNLLAWLAWENGVDEWNEDWPEDAKRQTVREAIAIQRRKGTVGSIRRAMINAGFGDATILEGSSGRTYNGTFTANGLYTYGDPSGWANYRVFLNRPMTTAQAAQVRRILAQTQPARCNLTELNFVTANNQYNGAITYNGAFTHGTA
jgi:phage tail P2-like protein